MFKRIWFPGIFALIIVGCVYWFFIRKEVPNNTPADTTTETGGVVQGPVLPGSASNNNQESMEKITKAVLHTNMGDIGIEFNPGTPKTVENFVKLAKAGFYDGTKFHRVIKGFMNQGGDPLSKDDSQTARWGTGGPGYQFADEIVEGNNKNVAGTLSMANAGPNTNGSQFFINVADNSSLDDKHTVFGMVTAGAEAVMAINAVETGENDRPVKPVIIESITLE